ncbi:hypothetical protein FQU76_08875 [Streptomyces qinzhouensis]|uniref:Uncharacterized protein n=1 Tax=Streptomyces qinzhouensis TaxID=2599401 RepID=A0A5B8JS54_9ACTN|nr:hypothetical protein FQU76_08875 [Streptomyces qinzhouensis]
MRAAVADGGRRVSIHVADEDSMALVTVLSHCAGAPDDDALLRSIAEVSSVRSCGTDAAPDGRRVWALFDAGPVTSQRRAAGAVPGL